MPPQDRQLDKLNKLLELIQNDTITPKELEQFLATMTEVIVRIRDQFETQSKESLRTLQEAIAKIKDQRSQDARSSEVMSQRIEDVLAEFEEMYQEVMNAKPKDGEPGTSPDPKEIVQETSEIVLEKLKPAIPDVEEEIARLSPEIRDSLEALQGEDRLDKKAIKGLENIDESIKNLEMRPAVVGGRALLQLYVDGRKKGAIQFLNLVAGNNVTLTYNRVGNRNDITINATGGGGGSFAVLAATGTVDDSNTSFTFASTPTLVIVNGASYRDGHGCSISGTAVTLNNPVGTGGDIYALG